MNMRSVGCWAVALLAGSIWQAGCSRQPPSVPSEQMEALEALPQLTQLNFVEVFPQDSTLQELLFRFNFSSRDIHRLIEDTRKVYNLNRIRAGHKFQMAMLSDGRFQSLRYEISDEEYLIVEPKGQGYSASRRPYVFTVRLEELSGVIQTSLWNTLMASGEDDRLVVAIYEILRWDVDFTAVNPGDWFKVIFEKKYLDGEFVKYGQILALHFRAGSRDHYGFRFVASADSRPKYYDQKGQSLRKAFLKVPFNFHPRISSGFSYARFHPILKRRRPHLAVDFAAPRGTPVLASANGRVIFAGWKGNYGRFVQIRHPNRYVTSYAHLSRILVKTGQRVSQGQRIGRVGSSGLSTGPHLDYRVQDSQGRFINPRRQVSWPSDKPVEKRHWNEFAAVRDRFLQQLGAIPDPELVEPGLRAAED